jgi:hypothetical protein
MENQSKNLETIKIEKDSLQVTLMDIVVNYWGLKVEKDTLNVDHIKL